MKLHDGNIISGIGGGVSSKRKRNVAPREGNTTATFKF